MCLTEIRLPRAMVLVLWLGLVAAPVSSAEQGPPVVDTQAISQVAVLPVNNRSGNEAPLERIREALSLVLEQEGFSTLGHDVFDEFMVRHRMRYTGGISRELARSLKRETGAGALLITTLDLFQERFPPKAALTCRLVSTEDPPRILWMDSTVDAGDRAPGFLGLGRVEDPDEILDRVIERLADSLNRRATYALRRWMVWPPTKAGPRRFRPKVTYGSLEPPILQVNSGRIAVLPFGNESTTPYAGQIITDQVIRRLVQAGSNVLEPGVLRQMLLETRQIQPKGPSIPQIDLVAALLDVDLLLFGEVTDYRPGARNENPPVVGFTTRIVDAGSRQIIWSSFSHTEGDDGVFFFDVGRVVTAQDVSARMAQALVSTVHRKARKGRARVERRERRESR